MDEHLVDLPLRDLVARMATTDPVPGGGSASAVAGALGAALTHMVVALSRGRPDAAPHEVELTEIGTAAAQFQSELLALAEADATAYASVVAARRLPRDTPRDQEARRVMIDASVREAIRAPRAIARAALEVMRLTERLAPIGHARAISDVGVATLLAGAALRGAAMNVEINLPSLPDDDPLRGEAATEIGDLLAGADDLEPRVRARVAERLR